jgi:hypothetical protein
MPPETQVACGQTGKNPRQAASLLVFPLRRQAGKALRTDRPAQAQNRLLPICRETC